MPERRVFKDRTRSSELRDARLIIIATEGQKTEKTYFEDLATESRNNRVHVKVLERNSTASSPEHILDLLDRFRSEYQYKTGYDELWLVCDVDRWRKKLSQVAEKCAQKGYFLAVSNPCFEIWLLLHLRSLENYDKTTLDEFRTNIKTNNRSRLEIELSNILGRYNPSNPDTTAFIPYVAIAIERAYHLDIQPKDRWPNDLGSRVYLLVKRILGTNSSKDRTLP